MLDFTDDINLILARIALGDDFKRFDLTNDNDKLFVSYCVKTYLKGAKGDSVARSVALKLSEPKYDENSFLKPESVLTEEEKLYLMGIPNLNKKINEKIMNNAFASDEGIIKK